MKIAVYSAILVVGVVTVALLSRPQGVEKSAPPDSQVVESRPPGVLERVVAAIEERSGQAFTARDFIALGTEEEREAVSGHFASLREEDYEQREWLLEPIEGSFDCIEVRVVPWPGIYERCNGTAEGSKAPILDRVVWAEATGSALIIYVQQDMPLIKMKDGEFQYLVGVGWDGWSYCALVDSEGRRYPLLALQDRTMEIGSFGPESDAMWQWHNEFVPIAPQHVSGNFQAVWFPHSYLTLGVEG